MVVGVCRLDLLIRASQSLKDKRQVLRKIGDRTRQKFNVALAEVGGNDLWQRSQIGFAVVGNEGRHVTSMVDTIVGFIDGLHVAEIAGREVELLNYGDTFGEEGEVEP